MSTTEQPLAHTLIKKGFWVYFFTFLTIPTSYVTRILISNHLSIAEVGILYSILGVMWLLTIYNDLGFKETLTYFLPKYLVHKQYNKFKTTLITVFILQLVTGIIFSILLYLTSDRLAIHYLHSPEAVRILHIFIVYFFVTIFYLSIDMLFMVFQDVFWNKLLDAIKNVAVMCFMIGVSRSMYDHSMTRYSLGWVIPPIISVIIGVIVFLTKYNYTLIWPQREWNQSDFTSLAKYAFWILIGNNLLVLFGQIDLQMIVYFLGTQMAGYYSNALTMSSIAPGLLAPIFGLILPMISQLQATKSTDRIALLVNLLIKYLWLGSMIISIYLLVFGPQIAFALYGPKRAYAGIIIRYLSISSMISTLTLLLLTVYAGLGEIRDRITIIITAIISLIIANFISIMMGRGVIGIAIITSIIQLFLYVAFVITLDRKHITIHYDRWFMIKNFVTCILYCGGIYYVRSWYLPTQRLDMTVWLGIIGVIYLIVVASINTHDIQAFVQQIKWMMALK